MDLTLKNREWREFVIGDEFEIKKSNVYHKKDLKETFNNGISYVSRTNLNNGVESIVKNKDYKTNPSNTITFGGENATFFYQPNEYITGNNISYIEHKRMNKYIGLFLQLTFNNSIKNCGFGYGRGLTGTRVKRRVVLLPVNSKNEPDYEFMEQYIKHKKQKTEREYQDYVKKRIEELEDIPKTVSLNEKEWKEFEIQNIFNINSGVRLTKSEMKLGETPFVGATDSNNGITEFVSNTNNSEDKNVLGVNYNGSVVENFYHPYTAIFSDDVKRLTLKDIEGNEFLYLFIKTIILKQKVKYRYGYKFNASRMKKQKILLPINSDNQPDYEFMENYMKNIEYKKLTEYFKIKTTNK